MEKEEFNFWWAKNYWWVASTFNGFLFKEGVWEDVKNNKLKLN